MVVVGIIMFVIAAVSILLGIMQLLEKGPLLNNAWLYADEEQLRTMNKRPYYIQSGIVFVMIGIQFMMLGFFALTKMKVFLILQFTVIGIMVITAVVSAVVIEKKQKKKVE